MIAKSFKKYDLLTVFIFIICYTLVFSFYTIVRHNSFHSHAFDLGIFGQVFWSIVHYGTMANTLETALYSYTPVNHLGVHFSLIYYLVAPVYAILQSPKTLLVIQSFMLGLGALPLYLIAREKTNATFFSKVLCISYLLFPALHSINVFDFHEIAFAPALILFTLYFLETKDYKWFWVFFALSLFVKEDIALSGFFLGLYVIFAKKEKKLGLLISLISLIYFFAATKILMPLLGQPYNFTDRYLAFKTAGYSGYVGIFYTMITHPLFTLQYVFLNPIKILYLIVLFYPVLFLPFCSKTALILIIPSLFTNLLSSNPDQYSIHTQYTGTIIPFIFFTAVMGYKNLPQTLAKYKKLVCYMLIILAIISTTSAIIKTINNHKFLIPSNYPENTTLNNLIKKIPPKASVATMSHIISHLTQRKEIWLFPNINNAEYVLFDFSVNSDPWPLKREEVFSLFENFIIDKKYGVLEHEGCYVLLRNGSNAMKNKKTFMEVKKKCS